MLQPEPNPIEQRNRRLRQRVTAAQQAGTRRKAMSAATWTAGGVLLALAAALFAYEAAKNPTVTAGAALTVLAVWMMVTAVLMVRR